MTQDNGSSIIPVPYISIWDGGIEVETTAAVNIKTGEVSCIATADVTGLDICEREYIVMNDEQVDVLTDMNGFDYWVDIGSLDAAYLANPLIDAAGAAPDAGLGKQPWLGFGKFG